jgi:redox-sensitive bicupin YhaK (pirin superfamily)
MLRAARAHSHGPAIQQRVDIMTTRDGRLQFPPLLAAMSREIAPGARTAQRRHEALDVVVIMLSGMLGFEPRSGDGAILRADDIAILVTGSGIDYRWRALGDEPARMVTLWLPSHLGVAPRLAVRRIDRIDRVGRTTAIAGSGTELPTYTPIAIASRVLAIGQTMVHDPRGRRCYAISTLGRAAIDGTNVHAGDGVIARAGTPMRIDALESTELLLVDVG